MLDVAVITGTRAEYGLLKPVMQGLRDSDVLHLRTIVTGAHLDRRFGETWREIADDGFEIDVRVPILGPGDSLSGAATALARAVSGVAEELSVSKPSALVALGDRYEAFAAVTAAYMLRVPVAHIAGGELTTGALDDGLRHAMTKLSHWHFAATGEYGRRIVQMGEEPARVHVVGALGVDAVRRTDVMSLSQLEASVGFRLGERYLVVTYHPETLDAEMGLGQVRALLRALAEMSDVHFLFTMPNADPGTDAVAAEIRAFVEADSSRSVAVPSLGQRRYLSAVSHALAVVGNSSSGIVEAPSLGVPTVNVGARQDGRTRAESVVDCVADAESIRAALRQALSAEFRVRARRAVSPFGDGHAAERIIAVVTRDLQAGVDLHKRFHDADDGSSTDAGR
ncbi:MAG: UDP-N-acetylglucosamine 2-epimerase [Coriobacteriia bacterium]